MSKRNLVWLVVVVVVGATIGVAVGWLWGVLAAIATLVVSEVVERKRRRGLREARGAEGSPSIKDAISHQRRRRR